MKKFIVKSGFIAKEDENDKKGNFVERSSIEIEALSAKDAKQNATNMSLFERKRAGWDPTAGPTLQVEELKPVNIEETEPSKTKIEASKEPVKVQSQETDKEPVKEPLKTESKEVAPKKKGPGRPRKNPK